MRSGIKRKLFRSSWWIAILVGAGAIGSLWATTDDRGLLVVSVTAAVLSVIFFVQQQRLAEMQLFKQLFVEFNQRYNALNDDLQGVIRDGVTTEKARMAVLDYFNLCAEEFLFYEEGYIDERVWKAWSNGMRIYFDTPPVAELWSAESRTDSYYGFSPERLR